MSSPPRSTLISQALRSYEPGELILSCSRPLVQVTKFESRLTTCDECFKTFTTGVVCPTCRKVYYCSEDCKTNAWQSIHRLECPIFVLHPPLKFETNGIDYMQRLALRLYLLLADSPEMKSKQFKLHNERTQTIELMESHRDQLRDTDFFKGILNYFKLYKIVEFDEELLLQCYGLLHVNSFGIDNYHAGGEGGEQTSELVNIEHAGCGLYIEASVFDHSCVPNACVLGDRLLLEVRALRPIEAGERIYIDYIQDIKPKSERVAQLEARYFFTCACAEGCQPQLAKPFDHLVDYRRLNVLNNLIDKLKPTDTTTTTTANQLYSLINQRLDLQQTYYASVGNHPCLALHYYQFLHFIIRNHHLLPPIDNEKTIQLSKKLIHQLKTTFGEEHVFYQTLVGVGTSIINKV